MKKPEHPLAKKIKKSGGIILPEPLFNEDGTTNPKTEKQLFDFLEHRTVGEKIRTFLKWGSGEAKEK